MIWWEDILLIWIIGQMRIIYYNKATVIHNTTLDIRLQQTLCKQTKDTE